MMMSNNVYKMTPNKIINSKIKENIININANNKITDDTIFIIINDNYYSLLLFFMTMIILFFQKKIISFTLSSKNINSTLNNLSVYFIFNQYLCQNLI